ncbi:hypothetical protein BJY04DRAFT_209984 [Aspergillus karnatakaensis]|uniref:uncharacterized protein n=1 Tax=Aspergillus karnatakaensis TaxID=1810916 RepID=UPI003CCE20CD
MDNTRETTGTKRKRDADEVTSTPEGNRDDTDDEIAEFDSFEDAWDEKSESDCNSKAPVLGTEFSPDGGTNRVVRIAIRTSRETRWENIITAECTHEGKPIGYALARFIYRGLITADFWGKMDEPSHDLEQIAWILFTRYGFLQEKFKSHPVHRGTGAWGSELDDGPLLIIEHVHITDREWRRKGLGRAMVRQLFVDEKKYSEDSSKALEDTSPELVALNYGSIAQYRKLSTVHAILRSGWLTSDVEPQHVGKSKAQIIEINHQAVNTAISFFRSLGFRRIGSSSCFGYLFDANHSTKLIPSDKDFDPQEEPLDDEEDEPVTSDHFSRFEMKHLIEERALSALRKNFPLHHAATTLSDLECVEYLKWAATEDDIDFSQVDRTHRTLLHALALHLKPKSVRCLIAHVDAAASWKTVRDLHGDSPLDVLKGFLEDLRTKRQFPMMNVHVSDSFRGFLLPRWNPGLSTSRLKFGCTCGQCIGGFLSPRMKLALLYEARELHDFLSWNIDDGRLWVLFNDIWIRYVADDSLRQGYENIFSRMRECLESNTAPSIENILQAVDQDVEWPPVTRNYLERTGAVPGVRAALLCIFNYFQKVYATEYSALSACRNDREFKFVAGACGFDPDLFGPLAVE